jgi:hypothetical protein
MKVEDVFTLRPPAVVRLHEKGSEGHAMPCHHPLEQILSSDAELRV